MVIREREVRVNNNTKVAVGGDKRKGRVINLIAQVRFSCQEAEVHEGALFKIEKEIPSKTSVKEEINIVL